MPIMPRSTAAILAALLLVSPTEGEEPMAVQHAHTNRLEHETSPYLLQHAHNPVDWYPWGPEAFEAARAAGKPIFLSIGYSTCYWCHVMERESFEDEATAAIMNEHFISIKVDREERPDVDDIYMAATQIVNRGQGGWPMSVFLEPETLKPFFAGTYFPPRSGFNRPGFPDLLERVAEVWRDQREAVLADADRLAAAVVEQLDLAVPERPLSRETVDHAVAVLMNLFDRTHAGWPSGQNKFPMPAYLDLLIAAAWDDELARRAIVQTLDRMATGGMYDQIGGGFHRYSTDPKWLVPHFEKMLYDNGQLASTYARAHELSSDPYYAEIVRETLDYVLREMTGPEGGFFSAQDAEVDAREGGNYLWLEHEIRDALTAAGLEADADVALRAYGLETVRDQHHDEAGWKDVVYLKTRPDELARTLGLELDALQRLLERVNGALLAVRDRRNQPGTDDKVLAGWNGLMIAGMADGGRVLGEKRYVEAARRAAEFVLTSMRADDGGLLRTWRGGRAKIDAFSVDYALVIRGLIALHAATGDARWRDEAVTLAGEMRERFWDASRGAYFDTLDGQQDLFVRTKSTYDGAVPSGNSVMLANLVELHALTGDVRFLDDAAAGLRALSGAIAANPMNTALATVAVARLAAEHPGRLDAASTQVAGGGGVFGAGGGDAEPVSYHLDAERVVVAEGRRVVVRLTLEIADGYHVNAHEPGPDFLIPLHVTVTGSDGVTATVDYPSGEPYQASYAEGGMLVHTSSVTVPITLERRAGEHAGKPKLVLTYQVCTDEACLLPQTVVLPLAIETP